ncbi:FAD-dependent oxidoreductase [bacterium]|nr:FAD-dependent oxidoreductase [bacterium]
MQKSKVIIVGGGLAGLSAAYELSCEEGFEIHLIEQDTRLGGRVHACTINGQGVDVGGFLVYPWYEHYHELIEELGLGEKLIKVPKIRDYFVNDRNSQDEYHEKMALSFKEIVEIFVKIFPKALTDRDPTAPELEAYDNLTVENYLKSLDSHPDRTDYYISVFDTYLQGYCYGSVTEHKIAFMASTLFQNMVHGDVHSASYLRYGSNVFIDAMAEKLRNKGVEIHLNCKLEAIEDKRLITTQGEMSADYFIFCQPPAAVAYSNFITVTVSYSGVAQIEDDTDWGSCFYREAPEQSFPILSIVNLEKLYGKEVAQHLNLNIKVNHAEQSPIGSTELLELIRNQLKKHFKEITSLELVNRVDWKKAMPIAQEDFVATQLAEQGKYNYYFAGDFMGCPAMETALRTGKRAAAQLINDVK